MWFLRGDTPKQPSYLKRQSSYVDRYFQMRHTRQILLVALLSAGLFLLPILIFANQNFTLFIKLADYMNPAIAKYIAKEQLQLNMVFAITFIAYGFFWFSLGKKITAKIVGPIKVLRNHIRLLSHNNYSTEMVRIREDDEFKELIITYNAFYKILQTQNERELDTLNKIAATVTNPVALNLVLGLVKEHQKRLQPPSPTQQTDPNPIFLNAEVPSASRGSRHAS